MGVIGRAAGDFSGVLDMPAVMEGSASVRHPLPMRQAVGWLHFVFFLQCLALCCRQTHHHVIATTSVYVDSGDTVGPCCTRQGIR